VVTTRSQRSARDRATQRIAIVAHVLDADDLRPECGERSSDRGCVTITNLAKGGSRGDGHDLLTRRYDARARPANDVDPCVSRAREEGQDLRPQRFAFARENVAAPCVFARRKHVIAGTNRMRTIEDDRSVVLNDVFERHHGIGTDWNWSARRDCRCRSGFVLSRWRALRVRSSAHGERAALARVRRGDREAVHRGACERDEIVLGHERTCENASSRALECDRFGA
jgi:hypothetical protein